jgi:hypothetical protein
VPTPRDVDVCLLSQPTLSLTLLHAQGLHPIRSDQARSVLAERLVLSDLSLTYVHLT